MGFNNVALFVYLVASTLLLVVGINRYRGDFNWVNMEFNTEPKPGFVSKALALTGVLGMLHSATLFFS